MPHETEPAPRYRDKPVSFVRRSGRMSDAQERAWAELSPRYVIEVQRDAAATSILPGTTIAPAEVYGRTAPLIVEIGSGQGHAIVQQLQVMFYRRKRQVLFVFKMYIETAFRKSRGDHYIAHRCGRNTPGIEYGRRLFDDKLSCFFCFIHNREMIHKDNDRSVIYKPVAIVLSY